MKKYLVYLFPILIIGVILGLNFGMGIYLDSKSGSNVQISSTDTQNQTPLPELAPPDPITGQGEKPSTSPTNHKPVAVSIPILMYHEIGNGPNSLYVPTEKFCDQMNYLSQNGYHTVTMTEALGMLVSGQIPAKTIVITFDDGYESFYTKAWPIMKEHGFTGTIYVITSFPGLYNYLTWEEIRTIQAEGMEIGSHSQNHKDLKKASASVQSDEIIGSKKILENKLGVTVKSFCYPSGAYGQDTPKVVRDAGYTSAVTVVYGNATPKSNFYLIPRIRVPGWITLENFAKNIPKS